MNQRKRKRRRRVCRKITKARLDEYLGLVGWYTRFHGAQTWRLYNPYDGCTVFQFSWDAQDPDRPLYDLRISQFGENRVFGKTTESYIDGGIMWFLLKDCTLDAYSEDDGETWEYVSLQTGPKDENGNYGAVLLFSPKFESRK